MKTKLFTLFLALAASVGTIFAYDIVVDGIWYELIDDGQAVKVIRCMDASSGGRYSGDIVIPSSINLEYVVTPLPVTRIGERAFEGCTNLTSVSIPNSVTDIEYGAFWACLSLTSIDIPGSVTSIGENAFISSGLTSVIISDGVTSIGDRAFAYCESLTSVTIPNSVTSIGEDAFRGCTGLTSIAIPNDVSNFGDRAFQCSGLTSVTIGSNVTSVGGCTFCGCGGLEEIYSYAIEPPSIRSCIVCEVVQEGCPAVDVTNCKLYVPAKSLEAYKAAGGWKEFFILPIFSEAIDETQSDENPCAQSTKLLRDGQIFILRGDKTYTLTGQEVK